MELDSVEVLNRATTFMYAWPWCLECDGYGFSFAGGRLVRCSRATERGHGRWFPMDAWRKNWATTSEST